ncbi:carboxypeptidase-like regulatory domain-containing protein [Pedobacter steynii]
MFFAAKSFAQNITVKGEVVDAETKGPIPAVNISVKGTKLGTATNSNGIYT